MKIDAKTRKLTLETSERKALEKAASILAVASPHMDFALVGEMLGTDEVGDIMCESAVDVAEVIGAVCRAHAPKRAVALQDAEPDSRKGEDDATL